MKFSGVGSPGIDGPWNCLRSRIPSLRSLDPFLQSLSFYSQFVVLSIHNSLPWPQQHLLSLSPFKSRHSALSSLSSHFFITRPQTSEVWLPTSEASNLLQSSHFCVQQPRSSLQSSPFELSSLDPASELSLLAIAALTLYSEFTFLSSAALALASELTIQSSAASSLLQRSRIWVQQPRACFRIGPFGVSGLGLPFRTRHSGLSFLHSPALRCLCPRFGSHTSEQVSSLSLSSELIHLT